MNVLVIGFHDDDTVFQLKKLNPDWQIVWIGNEKQHQAHPECNFCWENMQYGRVGNDPFSGACAEYYQKVYSQLLFYLRMMTRVSGDGWVDWTFHDYINLFNIHFDFFARLFMRHKPDLVIFGCLPHDGFDGMPYLLAKAMGIRILMSYQSVFPNRFFCVTSVEMFGDFDDLPLFDNPKPCQIEKRHFKHHPHLPPRPGYGFDFRTVRSLGRLLLDKGPARLLLRYFRMLDYRKAMAACCHSRCLRFDRPYVYFALHCQPELGTSTLGGMYDDQLLAIERLSKLIPRDWVVYAKENPVQTDQYRGKTFFQRLAKLPNVSFVSPRTSTFKLIEHCQFVATITGTVGWEAITGGKNVLAFGNPWYRTLPGVIVFDENMTIDRIMATTIDHEELEICVGNIISRMWPGVVDPSCAMLYDAFDHDENARAVARGLTAYLRHFVTSQPPTAIGTA